MEKLYPMLFKSVYKKALWGGTKLAGKLNRNVPETAKPCGEAWEVCDRADAQTPVENGPLAGTDLCDLAKYGEALFGRGRSFQRFPLLIKLIDAGQHLSVQVHPDERACEILADGSEPKTEMWFLVDTDPGALIFAGLSKGVTKESFLELAHTPDIAKCMNAIPGVPGDAFYIHAGTVHAIGAGNLLLEIQQNSDTTFRVSDWNRVGADGKPRQLHLDKAMVCIDFAKTDAPFVEHSDQNRDIVTGCPFFAAEALELKSAVSGNTEETNSFHLLSAAAGSFTVKSAAGDLHVDFSRTCVIPASVGKYEIVPDSAKATVVRAWLPKA